MHFLFEWQWDKTVISNEDQMSLTAVEDKKDSLAEAIDWPPSTSKISKLWRNLKI